MATIHFIDTNEYVEVPDGSTIKDVCKEHGIAFGCQQAICGTCITEVLEGQNNLEEPNQRETDHFLGHVDKSLRLMCQARIKSGQISIRQ